MSIVLRDVLQQDLNELLDVEKFNDYAPNGMQVEGNPSIQTLCTAVTASESAIRLAIKHNSQALLVHHGYFWNGENPVLTGIKRQRLSLLLEHNLNLFAYHLPLDCHLEHGNNKGMGDALQLVDMQAIMANKIPNLLWHGRFRVSKSLSDLCNEIKTLLKREPLAIKGHNRPIQSIAWCTGAAQDCIEQAFDLGVDAFISGEISERTYYQANELGIVYIAAGHHATERFGVQRIGQYLANKYSISHYFIDSDNPV